MASKYVTMEQFSQIMNALSQMIADKEYEQKKNLGGLAYYDEISDVLLSGELLNELNGKASVEEIQALIGQKRGAAYVPMGSISAQELLAIVPGVDNRGHVWNIKDQFVTTNDFAEGADFTYGAGTNVAVIEIPSENEGEEATYKFDVLAGMVDTSEFAKATELQGLLDEVGAWQVASNEDIQSIIDGV